MAVQRQVMIVRAKAGHASAVAAEARRLGGRVEARLGNLVQVRAPAGVIEKLSSSGGVVSVDTPLLHVPAAVTGQEISASGVEGLHASGVTGKGVKIAVIDIGFAGAKAAIDSGDLPANSRNSGVLRGIRRHCARNRGRRARPRHGSGRTALPDLRRQRAHAPDRPRLRDQPAHPDHQPLHYLARGRTRRRRPQPHRQGLGRLHRQERL